VLQTADRR